MAKIRPSSFPLVRGRKTLRPIVTERRAMIFRIDTFKINGAAIQVSSSLTMPAAQALLSSPLNEGFYYQTNINVLIRSQFGEGKSFLMRKLLLVPNMVSTFFLLFFCPSPPLYHPLQSQEWRVLTLNLRQGYNQGNLKPCSTPNGAAATVYKSV